MNTSAIEPNANTATNGGLDLDALKGSVKLGVYLKRLRTGYGYSLRKVEEKARQRGGDIDNSQLSRYEKGVCYPSFDKLRVLAQIFNVSIQSFSDVVDLERFEDLKPATGEPETLLLQGNEEYRLGNYDKAYAIYERAIELLDEDQAAGGASGEAHADARSRARLSKSFALVRLGKLALAEHELRQILKTPGAAPGTTNRALLQLSNVHAELGDMFLARIEAENCLTCARAQADRMSEAFCLHALARIASEERRVDEGIELYRQALRLYEELGNKLEALNVRAHIGMEYLTRGTVREGMRILTETLEGAKRAGYRRSVAYTYSMLAIGLFNRGDYSRVKKYTRESDAIAGSGDVKYVDILFLNAYYLWKISRAEGNLAQERIAFGRLKYLRPSLERTFPEVSDFDAFIEKGRTQ